MSVSAPLNCSSARKKARDPSAEVLEIVFVVGYQIVASKFAKAFRLAPQGFSGR